MNKLIISLQNGTDLRVRRFKKHDRLYWITKEDKLEIMADLRVKIEDLDTDTKDYILKHAVFLN